MKKNLKNINYIVGAIVGICLIYYSIKFYDNIFLSIDKINMILWMILIFMSTTSTVIGCYTCRKVETQDKEIKELKNVIIQLAKSEENHAYNILDTLNNSREISLDILEEIEKGK